MERQISLGDGVSGNAMGVLEAIGTRRSVREFLPDPVPTADLDRILDAARHAPSAANGQPWRFLVVVGRENLGQLYDRAMAAIERRIDSSGKLASAEKPAAIAQYRSYAEKVFSAPVFVFVFVETGPHPNLVDCDGALAVQNLLLAAHALGYGSCVQTSLFPEELVRDHFGAPTDYRFLCAVPIGKAAAFPEDPGRRPLDELVWRECFPTTRAEATGARDRAPRDGVRAFHVGGDAVEA